MSKSLFLFHQPSRRILALLEQSAAEPDPADFLYREKLRSLLFILESLARILQKSGDEDMAKPLKQIKKLEDALGRIEDYDCYYRLFSEHKAVKKKEAAYFRKKRDKELHRLNRRLRKKDFYRDLFWKLASDGHNFNTKHAVHTFRKEIGAEIDICFKFYSEYPEAFDSMEGQVHEIRRKLRWLSIYGQSLDGIVMLSPDRRNYAWEKEFITAYERRSPYNTLPVSPELPAHIRFHKKAFLAKSHVITALGKIKDRGLQLEYLATAIRKTGGCSRQKELAAAAERLEVSYTEAHLLKEAHALLEDFFVTYGIHRLLLEK